MTLNLPDISQPVKSFAFPCDFISMFGSTYCNFQNCSFAGESVAHKQVIDINKISNGITFLSFFKSLHNSSLCCVASLQNVLGDQESARVFKGYYMCRTMDV